MKTERHLKYDELPQDTKKQGKFHFLKPFQPTSAASYEHENKKPKTTKFLINPVLFVADHDPPPPSQ